MCVHVCAICGKCCEAVADSHLSFVPLEQMYGTLDILVQAGILSFDGSEMLAVSVVLKLIANSSSAAKVALMEMTWEAESDKLRCSMSNACEPILDCTEAQSMVMLIRS